MTARAGGTALEPAGRGLGRELANVWRRIRDDVVRSYLVSALVFRLRFLWLCRVRRALRTVDSPDAFPATIAHNLRSLRRKLDRMALLIAPLSVLEQVGPDARILVIGPRNEWDLFLLHRYGFRLGACTGLDLITYSPWIDLGDMHAMPYADGHFDVVLCGWTLSYSARPQDACREIARVCRPGGVIGVAVEYSSADEAHVREATGGYVIQDERLPKRVNSVGQILALFPGHGPVLFSHDAPLRRSHPDDVPPSNCATLFARA